MKVLNFYHIGKVIPENAEYIGRYNHNFNLKASKFANPFPMKKPEDRPVVIEQYKAWIWQQLMDEKITRDEVLALKDKNLVCYCAPLSCHGDILIKLIDYLFNNEEDFYRRLNNYKMTKMKIFL